MYYLVGFVFFWDGIRCWIVFVFGIGFEFMLGVIGGVVENKNCLAVY